MDWTDYKDDDGRVEIAEALGGAAKVELWLHTPGRSGAYGTLNVNARVTVEFDYYATVDACKAAIEGVARKLGVVA